MPEKPEGKKKQKTCFPQNTDQRGTGVQAGAYHASELRSCSTAKCPARLSSQLRLLMMQSLSAGLSTRTGWVPATLVAPGFSPGPAQAVASIWGVNQPLS